MIDRVIGNYRIVEKVGEGGMGTVYRAVDLMLEREVAIKAIRPELSREPEIVERFRAEARMLARWSHPAIATIYSFFVEGDDLFLVMEFVRGRSLSWLLKGSGPLPWERAVPLLAGALDGIEQAHRAGIVHRDLKSDNLMITESGVVKVMDFGIARLIGSSRLTRTGLLVGTLHYMAPEQIRGEAVDRRADVYALGAVLYEMLTGRVPFEGGSDFAVLKAHVEENPAPPSAAISGFPAWLDEAILKALAKDPAQRFQTVDELRLFLLGQGSPAAAGTVLIAPTAAIGRIGLPLADLPTLVKTPIPAGAAPPARPLPQPSAPQAHAGHPAPAPAAGASAAAPGPGSTAVSGTTLAPPPPAPPAETPPWLQGSPAAQAPEASPASRAPEASPAARAPSPPATLQEALAPATPAGGRRPALVAILAVAALAATVFLYRMFAAPSVQPRPAAAVKAGSVRSVPVPARAQDSPPSPRGSANPGAPAAPPGGMDTGLAGPDRGAGEANGGPDQSNAPPAAVAPDAGSGLTAAAPPLAPTAGRPSSGAQPESAGRKEERGAKAEGGDGTAAGAPAESGGTVARTLPADELRQLGSELETESGQLRKLYADFLSQKEKGGKRLGGSDDKLKEELKELQHAAESFAAPFQTGFWARTRSRLGRFGHSEDQNAQITRLARALVGSGKRADALMAQVKPDPAVRQLWRRIHRQWRRIAEICGV
jgi:tRNA A-37 threonylcarbamoyl transferase component Bud32